MIRKVIFEIVVVTCLVGYMAIPSVYSEGARDIALLLKASGSVEIQKNNSGRWQTGARGMRFNSGDRLRTGDRSMATLIFTDDKSLMKIRSNSTVTIQGERQGRAISKRLSMGVGEMWAKIRKGGGGYRMETPSGVAAVKGTEFYLLVAEDGSSTAIVLEGLLEMFNEIGRALVEAGYTGKMSKGSTPQIEQTTQQPDWGGEDVDIEEGKIKIEFEDEDGNKKYLLIKYGKPEEQ